MASISSGLAALLRFCRAAKGQGGRTACWPLSYHLIVLALATILPLLIFAGIGLKNSVRAERAAAHQNAQGRVNAAMARVDHELLVVITLLNVLARDAAFDRHDYRLLHDRAKEAVLDRKGDIQLIGADNRVVFSTSAAFGAELAPPLRGGDAQAPAAAIAPQPFVTDLVAGRPDEPSKLAVIVPIVRGGQAVARLILTIDPAELNAVIADPELPAEWQFALADRAGKTIAGGAPLVRVGERMPQSLLGAAHEDAGLFEVPAETQPLLAAYRRSDVTGWVSYVLIPRAVIEMPLARDWREFLTTGFTFLALSLFAAYMLSRKMTRPIVGLARAATELGRGEEFLTPQSSLLEANLLGKAIGAAAVELRHRTEALSESERRFRLFADRTTDAIWFFDMEKRRIDYMSPAFETIWGRSKADFTGIDDWRRTAHPEDLVTLDDEVAQHGVGGVEAEYRIVRPDGSVRWIRDTRFPLEGSGGSPRIVAGIVRDITERKEAMENLTGARTDAENRLAELEHLYECSPIGLAVVGRDYRVHRVNDFIAGIKGRSHDDLLGHPLFELLPEIQAVAEPAFRRIVEGGGAVTGAEFQTEHGGRAAILWAAHFYPIVVSGQGVTGIGMILENITEEKAHQRALARLAAIVHAANDAMFSTSRSGLILNWNPAAEALFQFNPEEVTGRPFSMLFRDPEAASHETLLEELRNGESARLDTELCRKDGVAVPVSISIAPIRTGDEFTAVSITIEDITERKLFDQRQMLMNRELAHRVKNSLAVIQAMARQTLRSSSTPQAFATAFEGRLQALSTSHNLLTASQWEGAELGELIRAQLAPNIASADQLRLSGPPVNLPPGTATSLGLVLHELSTNAAKYGALSVPAGKVGISWTVSGAGKDRQLLLDWRESGGPAVTRPQEKGFGSTLIAHSGKATQHFDPEGLHCTVQMAFLDIPSRAY
jgi:PAS domain S-box-containing protein